MQVTSAASRPKARDQIAEILAKHPELRLRVEVRVYDPSDRQYNPLRETFWQVVMPTASTTVGEVEELLQVLEATMQMVGTVGAAKALERLEP